MSSAPQDPAWLQENALLASMAQQFPEVARAYAISRPSTPPTVLADLADDADGVVRLNLPRAKARGRLRRLAEDPSLWVRLTAARNPSMPPDIGEASSGHRGMCPPGRGGKPCIP